ncbi:zinc-finger domain-containing protein [Mangrovibacillus cuniculi]|uniref:Zinc-finger domain-containing protein n=1 Tax=Mangrovibacillus cuniculi TaxID=2593652 RepID=A0A7S8HFL5_9BACI|nr:zinc-finger domain-containing protein [Mangrovibacillus cuniculi]QPC46641.1 zinc-finger domain-containing protein [Mangrovibacillus cuniculi]
MNRTSAIKEVDYLLETYCEGCLVKQVMKKDRGRKGAHQFCISSCTVGEQLKKLGEELK